MKACFALNFLRKWNHNLKADALTSKHCNPVCSCSLKIANTFFHFHQHQNLKRHKESSLACAVTEGLGNGIRMLRAEAPHSCALRLWGEQNVWKVEFFTPDCLNVWPPIVAPFRDKRQMQKANRHKRWGNQTQNCRLPLTPGWMTS